MRILRSQYMKYKAQQGLEATTASKTTTTMLTALHDETQMRHISSKKTNLDEKSIQTVTQTTRTTVRRSSILQLKDNSTATLYRRNTSIPLNDTKLTTNSLQKSPRQENKNSNCLDNSAPALVIQQRRQTVACAGGDDFIKQQVLNALKIKLLNTPCNRYTRINLVVKFYDEGATWYTRFYRSYQDTLWLKMPRTDGGISRKWYFKCEVCQKKLCSFTTLKSHLNIHMGFFPNRCDICPKQYSARTTLVRHKKIKHG